MEFKDYYQVLGLARTASADEIKKAYRKLARKHHPDVSKAADANERMTALNEANAVLSDPQRRMAYDSLGDGTRPSPGDGHSAQGGHEFRPPPHWDAGFEFSDRPADNAQFSAFFEELFGRAGRAGHDTRADAEAPSRGRDHHARIEQELLDAYHGATRIVTLRNARLDDGGQLRDDERHLQIKIPKGVFEGQHIRLAGRGGPGRGSAPAGDLLLEVLFRPDPRWRAEGRDVHQGLPVSPWEAVLGGRILVRTPGGEAEVTLPAGWKAGRKLRLKGRGIPGTAGVASGDLYLGLELGLPPADTTEARAAYETFARTFPTFDPRRGAGA